MFLIYWLFVPATKGERVLRQKCGRSALFKTEIAYFIGKPTSEPLGHGTKRWHKGSSQTILCASVGRRVGCEVVLSAYTKHAGGDALTLIMDGLTAGRLRSFCIRGHRS